MKIVITGLTGSGKSTLGKKLAKELGLKYVSGGDLLKQIIAGEKAGYAGWWETEEGEKAMNKRKEREEYDREVDRRLLEIMEKEENVLVDSWTASYLYKKRDAVKIYLKADIEERAKRVSRRDGISVEEAKEAIEKKDRSSIELYDRLYGFRLDEDLTPFNLVLDTTKLDEDDAFKLVLMYVKRWFCEERRTCENDRSYSIKTPSH
ncbi:MAG: (d)CMP kinase [Candidatus Methanodesulfokora sp.]